MQPDFLASLLTERDRLLVQKRELQAKLCNVDGLITDVNDLIKKYKRGSSRGELKMMPPVLRLKTKRPRVRGVLAAARKAVDQLSGPFDKNELLAKLIEIDQNFAHKKVTGSNLRNALRLLTQNGVIKVESEATATSCAKYVKAA